MGAARPTLAVVARGEEGGSAGMSTGRAFRVGMRSDLRSDRAELLVDVGGDVDPLTGPGVQPDDERGAEQQCAAAVLGQVERGEQVRLCDLETGFLVDEQCVAVGQAELCDPAADLALVVGQLVDADGVDLASGVILMAVVMESSSDQNGSECDIH